MIGKIGDYAERMILDMLRSEGALVEPQVKFELPAHNVFGKIDGIVKVEGKEKGLEIKSIGSSKYIVNQIFGSPWSEPTPKWQHLFQTLVYCYAFRERVDEFILLYIRRDTCETKEFVISTFAEGDLIYPVIDGKVDYRFTVNDILERYRLLMQYIEDDKIPERDYVKLYPQDQIPRYVKAGILSKRQAEIYKDAPFGDIECKLCGYADLCDRES